MSSSWSSSVFCFANAALYVLILYLVPVEVRSLPRDNPTHIKYRLVLVSIATVMSLLSLAMMVPYQSHGIDYWSAIGMQFGNILSSLLVTFVLMCTFYLGPLTSLVQFGFVLLTNEVKHNGALVPLEVPRTPLSIVRGWIDEYWRQYGDIVLLRNIVVGPITEEIVFRAVMIPSMVIAAVSSGHHTSQLWIAAVNPLWFGVAHAHHLIDRARHNVPLKSNIVTTLVQLLYTSIFGFMAALLFLRTGNIFCPILSHIMCNLIGLPDIGFMNRTDGMRSSSEYSCLYEYRFLHLFLHGLGLILFGFVLYPATEFLQEGLPYSHISR